LRGRRLERLRHDLIVVIVIVIVIVVVVRFGLIIVRVIRRCR
jgi:hypothetical protein